MLCNRLARLGLALIFAYPTLSQNTWAQTESSHVRHLNAPLSFEANQGQADPFVQFLARGADYHLTLSRSGIALRLRNQDDKSAQPAEVTMDLVLPGEPSMLGEELQRGKSNYFVGNDSSRWVTNVANYGRVHYRSVYPGTDLVFYGNQGSLEYDFRLEASADPHDSVRCRWRKAAPR